jgi:hypothetical protein
MYLTHILALCPWDDLRLHVCNKPNCGTTCRSSWTAAQLSLIRASALPPHCLRMRGMLCRNHMINVPPIVQSQTAQCPFFLNPLSHQASLQGLCNIQ